MTESLMRELVFSADGPSQIHQNPVQNPMFFATRFRERSGVHFLAKKLPTCLPLGTLLATKIEPRRSKIDPRWRQDAPRCAQKLREHQDSAKIEPRRPTSAPRCPKIAQNHFSTSILKPFLANLSQLGCQKPPKMLQHGTACCRPHLLP